MVWPTRSTMSSRPVLLQFGQTDASSAAPDAARSKATETSSGPVSQGLTASASGLLALQRRAGNRAAISLLQAKLEVGAVNDPEEREADHAAESVMAGDGDRSRVSLAT